jgi:hypothetical protein
MSLKNPLKILLLSSPTFIGSFFLNLWSQQPAKAVELNLNPVSPETQKAPQANLNCDRQNCSGNNHLSAFTQMVSLNDTSSVEQFPNVDQDQDGHLLLNVSEEESDAAVALFGCDCVKAINALRQLRGIPIGVEGDRILPGPMIRPCTQRLPEA